VLVARGLVGGLAHAALVSVTLRRQTATL
jgi:hypothetical protein